MVGLSYKVLDSFFDRPKVIAAVDKAERGVLSKAGAFVRTRARSSMRRSKKSAEPGQPPRSHAGDLKRGIVFAYDRPRRSVVIGPLAYNVDGGEVPRLLEKGGTIKRRFKRRASGRVLRMRGRRLRPGEKSFVVSYRYRAFPYMSPALEAEAPNFPSLWRNEVR